MLKAARYAKDCDPKLVAFITNELPFLSFFRAAEYYADVIPTMRREEYALLGANDRFLLLTQILRRTDACHEWLYERCREVESDPDDHLDLWARYHFKSTIITFAGTIQEIINNPEITIGIFGGTLEIVGPFLNQIKTELEDNPTLPYLYPDVFWSNPRKEAPRWSSDDGIVVKRQGNPKEATVEAHAIIDAMPTGRHFGLRVYDDLINERMVSNETMLKKVITRLELSYNLGNGVGGDRKQFAGTRYLYSDAYGALIERGSLKPRIYPATDDGRLTGIPVFLSPEKWEEIKRDQRSTVAAQMLMNPIAGEETMFIADWLRPYAIRPRLLNIYILVDPSKGRSATSDRTAIAVIGIDATRNRYLLDGYCHRMKMSDRYTAVKELNRKWEAAPGVQMVRVGWEQYGLQTDVEYVEERMAIEKVSMNIEEVNWTRDSKQSKPDRVERLEPYFKNSQFYLPPKIWHPDHGVCHWKVNTNVTPEQPEPILYTPVRGETTEERGARVRSEAYRIMAPIRRRDELGDIYDLLRSFFTEFLMFPFTEHDDLIDVVSRIEDMEPAPPVVVDRVVMAQVTAPDA